MQQLPTNKPVCPIVNFRKFKHCYLTNANLNDDSDFPVERNGFMAFDNQGSQPDYRSSSHPPHLLKPPYPASHQEFVGEALQYLSHLTLRKHRPSIYQLKSC